MKIDYPATIIKVRATLNLSQVELAEMLDVSFASVNRWENGKYEPTRLVKEKIRLICKQHNIEMEAKECNSALNGNIDLIITKGGFSLCQ